MKHNAVTIKLCGGQGNQMFQYAAVYTLARQKSVPFYFETSRFIASDWDLYNEIPKIVPDYQEAPPSLLCKVALLPRLPLWLKQFLRRLDWLIDLKIKHTFVDKNTPESVDAFFALKTPVLLSGYFASEKYFAPYKGHIIETFSTMPLGKQATKLAHAIQSSQQSIALHYRDYTEKQTGNQAVQDSMGYLPLDFYEKSITSILDNTTIPLADTKIFVFSNSISYAKSFFKDCLYYSSMVFVSYKIEYNWEDMKLMSLCDHIVIANSTYSWWAAYLNTSPNKIVCTHKTWGKLLKNNPNPILFPAGWTLIE